MRPPPRRRTGDLTRAVWVVATIVGCGAMGCLLEVVLYKSGKGSETAGTETTGPAGDGSAGG